MRIFILSIFFFAAISATCGKTPLTLEQLTEQADQICNGRITAVHHELQCLNQSCTNQRINSIAKLTASSCQLNGSYFTTSYTEGVSPPEGYGHNPEPLPGQEGTLYIRGGAILYPNGWQPSKQN